MSLTIVSDFLEKISVLAGRAPASVNWCPVRAHSDDYGILAFLLLVDQSLFPTSDDELYDNLSFVVGGLRWPPVYNLIQVIHQDIQNIPQPAALHSTSKISGR
jgi:hypothetical protein